MATNATRKTTDALATDLKEKFDHTDTEIQQCGFWYDEMLLTTGDVSSYERDVLNAHGFEFSHFRDDSTAYGAPYIVWERN
jgi:hypothetical protein